MKREVKVTEYTCDACGASRYSNPDLPDEPVFGLSGTIAEISGTGGYGTTWWACSRRCAKTAPLAALQREAER